MHYDVIIIGGGAAGFFAAANLRGSHSVLILEKARQPLGKVRISGGGRCNLTRACFEPWQLVKYYPRGAKELLGAFTRFQPWDTMRWFEARGVQLKIEADGRVFPASDDSGTIVDCLLSAAQSAGAEVICQAAVFQIEHTLTEGLDRFLVQVRHTAPQNPGSSLDQTTLKLTAQNILLATGGSSQGFALAAGLGHSILAPVPSLFTFQIRDPRLEGLAGLSVPEARIQLHPHQGQAGLFEQTGPLLITHWGVSGPAVLQCSAWAARWLFEQDYHADLEINWLSPLSLEQVLAQLHAYKADPGTQRQTILAGKPFKAFPTRLWQRLVSSIQIKESDQWANLSKAGLLRLAQALCTGRYEITGKGQHKDEFVTCGGVSLPEVDFKTMQSRLVPGLFFAGEVLDIDGLTGGFNFQSAWTTGYLASQVILAA
ncbi:MAG: NAD(P)/FAD-dependent oxidoreductase [Anaerolineales bacterium]|jgi:hypothetical protein|nr:NAD(P)/FAD-dependent oxidoreductase [Anaerolineales bacterium]